MERSLRGSAVCVPRSFGKQHPSTRVAPAAGLRERVGARVLSGFLTAPHRVIMVDERLSCGHRIGGSSVPRGSHGLERVAGPDEACGTARWAPTASRKTDQLMLSPGGESSAGFSASGRADPIAQAR